MKIRHQLLILIAVSLLGMVGVGAFGIWNLRSAQHRFDFLTTDTMPSVHNLSLIQDAVNQLRLNFTKLQLPSADKEGDKYIAAIEAGKKQFDDVAGKYAKKDVSSEHEAEMLNQVKDAVQTYYQAYLPVLPFLKAHQLDQVRDVLHAPSMQAAGPKVMKLLQQMRDYNDQLAFDKAKANNDAYQFTMMASIAVMVLVAATLLLLGGMLVRNINSGLQAMQLTMEKISQSLDFTLRIPARRPDELGQTANAFNRLIDAVQNSLKQVLSGARNVSSSSVALKDTAHQVSTAAGEQSQAAATMAANIEQMTVSINHVAEQAQSSRALARESGEMAKQSSVVIGQTIKDIHEISDAVKISASSIRQLENHSGKVGAVVAVIRDIADQTNLLALNAAIEAARAGEQGRGFAVVADEVRKLAERTTRSTQEISSTISAMVSLSEQAISQIKTAEDRVADGVERADQAGKAITDISEASERTASMVEEISTAIVQQGAASNGVAQQIERTAQMAEESASAAGQTADSADYLDKLAGEQMSTLSRFRLD